MEGNQLIRYSKRFPFGGVWGVTVAIAATLLACQDNKPQAVAMRSLGEGWSMPIDVHFKRQATDSEVVFTRQGRTVHVAFYEIGANETIDQAIEFQAKGIKPAIEEKIEHQVGAMKGRAFTYPDSYQGQKVWVVHGFMGSKNSLAEVTFYLEAKENIHWAVETWKGLQYRPK